MSSEIVGKRCQVSDMIVKSDETTINERGDGERNQCVEIVVTERMIEML